MRAIRLTALLFVLAQSAVADDPANILLQYIIHQDPNDAASPVLMEAVFELQPVTLIGDAIEWSLVRVTLHEPDPAGGPGTTWVDQDPDLHTPGQTWLVTHDDPSNPTNADFGQLPGVAGVAAPVAGSAEHMEYALSGVAGAQPSDQPGGALLVSLNYRFARWQWMIQTENGEPVHLPPVYNPEPVTAE